MLYPETNIILFINYTSIRKKVVIGSQWAVGVSWSLIIGYCPRHDNQNANLF